MSLKAVLFDLDGVLVKSKEAWFRTVEHAGQVFRGSPVTREEFEPTFGQGTDADARVFRLGITEAELNAFYEEQFPRYAQNVWVDPTAEELLRGLATRGLKRAVVTNCTTPVAHALLRGLRPRFDALACADEAPSKPAPDLVLLACGKLGVLPDEAVLVGDSRFDLGAAAAAGAHFVAFGFDPPGHRRADSLLELLTLLVRE